MRVEHQIDRRQARLVLPKIFADQPLDAVACTSRSDGFFCDGQSQPGMISLVGPEAGTERLALDALAFGKYELEFRRFTQPRVGLKPRANGHWNAYGIRRARPLARRRASTRRPPLVAIRARKPWVRLRRRVCGWKVRFMTLISVADAEFTELRPVPASRQLCG